MTNILDIREKFVDAFLAKKFITDKSGVKTVEIVGSSFMIEPDELYVDHIFGDPNYAYIAAELEWYDSMSLRVDAMGDKTPEIWTKVASKDGLINSNYGYLVYSEGNGSQFENVVMELSKNRDSRRAIAIYTRPSMHTDYNKNGMSDFVCTNTVQYLIRNNELNAIVNMRSNDAIFGYRNDFAWQRTMLERIALELDLAPGEIYWQTGSLHIYERHFYLIHHYANTSETSIKKKNFDSKYNKFEY